MSKTDHHYSEDRDDRVKDSAEVFTPPELVNKMLDGLDVDWSNIPTDKTFLDPTCGSGNFLIQVAGRGIPIENIYGVDLFQDNVTTCRKRLFNIVKTDSKDRNLEIVNVLKRNIRQGDALEFDYENDFDKPIEG